VHDYLEKLLTVSCYFETIFKILYQHPFGHKHLLHEFSPKSLNVELHTLSSSSEKNKSLFKTSILTFILALQDTFQSFQFDVEIILLFTDKSGGQLCARGPGFYVQRRHRQPLRVSLQSLLATTTTLLYNGTSTSF
jgi:hypothetical protein